MKRVERVVVVGTSHSAVLQPDERIEGGVFRRRITQYQTATRGARPVDVVLTQAHVVDVAAGTIVVGENPNAEQAFDQRQVEHSDGLGTRVAMLQVPAVDFDRPAYRIERGLASNEADRAGLRVGAEGRALRALENFDPL